MAKSPAPTAKPGTQTQQPRGEKSMPEVSAKPIAAENQETRKGANKSAK